LKWKEMEKMSKNVVFPPYSPTVLNWEVLPAPVSNSSLGNDGGDVAPATNASFGVQKHIQEILQTKSWLLSPDQKLSLPPTHLDNCTSRVYSLGDFIQKADMAAADDLLECAKRSTLSRAQFQEIRTTGRLTVPSIHFEDQHHTWQVAHSFYLGTETVRTKWMEGMGAGLDHMIVYAGDTIRTGEPQDSWLTQPTLHHAVQHGGLGTVSTIGAAVHQLVGAPCRYPKYSAANVDKMVELAKEVWVSSRLLEELDDALQVQFWSCHDEGTLFRNDSEIALLWNEIDATGVFAQPSNNTAIRPAKVSSDERLRYLEEIQRLRKEFYKKILPNQEAEFVASNEEQQEERWSPKTILQANIANDAIWRHKENQLWLEHLEHLAAQGSGSNIVGLEAKRLRAVEMEWEEEQKDKKEIETLLCDYEQKLRRHRPILSWSKAWRNKKLLAKRKHLEAERSGTRAGRVRVRLNEKGLHVQARGRELEKEFDEALGKELEGALRKKTTTFPPAVIEISLLNPNYWTGDAANGYNKVTNVEVALDRYFWRIRYSWLTYLSVTKSMIGGAYRFLTSGPLSLRALLGRNAYYAVERPSRDPYSLTSTWWSRLSSFYQSLRQARENFELQSDTGLVGKSILRFIMKVNHTIKAVIGTVAISCFMVFGTLVGSALSTTCLICAPVMASFWTTLVVLFHLTVHDNPLAAARHRGLGRYNDAHMVSAVSPLIKLAIFAPYKFLVTGALQSVLATFRLAVFHPVMGVIHFSWASLGLGLRAFRDSITWQILRMHGRVPSSDSFLAWRIHGPGLAAETYYRLPLEAAKASVLLALDRMRLAAHSQVREVELDLPFESYQSFFQSLLGPFDLSVHSKLRRPSTLASKLCCRAPSGRESTFQLDPRLVRQGPDFDVWDVIAKDVRAANPMYAAMQLEDQNLRWAHQPSNVTTPLHQVDRVLESHVQSAVYDLSHGREKNDPDPEWTIRPARMLAIWNLQAANRDWRLADANSIPDSVRGRFRMDESDCQELWEFTKHAVTEFVQGLQSELEDLSSSSNDPKAIEPVVKQVLDFLYQGAGARPGQDTLLTALLLRTILGGHDALETLKDTDEHLVLSPKMSPVEEHLVFWQSVVGRECVAEAC
jgi:hypothetical protein